MLWLVGTFVLVPSHSAPLSDAVDGRALLASACDDGSWSMSGRRGQLSVRAVPLAYAYVGPVRCGAPCVPGRRRIEFREFCCNADGSVHLVCSLVAWPLGSLVCRLDVVPAKVGCAQCVPRPAGRCPDCCSGDGVLLGSLAVWPLPYQVLTVCGHQGWSAWVAMLLMMAVMVC